MPVLVTTPVAEEFIFDKKADWLLVFEAALRVGNFSSLDDLMLYAVDAWLAQLPFDLRWKIALELYANERVSTGRAAQIAGLSYVYFMEELRKRGLPFISAELASKEEELAEEAILDELFDFTKI